MIAGATTGAKSWHWPHMRPINNFGNIKTPT